MFGTGASYSSFDRIRGISSLPRNRSCVREGTTKRCLEQVAGWHFVKLASLHGCTARMATDDANTPHKTEKSAKQSCCIF